MSGRRNSGAGAHAAFLSGVVSVDLDSCVGVEGGEGSGGVVGGGGGAGETDGGPGVVMVMASTIPSKLMF